MKKPILILLCLVFVSCAGLQTASEYDRNTNIISVNFEGKTFYVQDNEIKSSALVSESFGTDFMKGLFEGLTLTLVDLTAPVGKFEGAMKNYLVTYKNSDCEITRSNFISDGIGGGIGYEIFYKCKQGD